MPRLRLHGPPGVALDDGRAIALSAREAALLAWLHLEGPTPRGPLAGRLWPGGDDAKARANLRQTLARLKRSAGDLIAEADGVLRLAPGVTVAQDGDARLLGALEFDDAPELADWLAARRESAQRDRQRQRMATARQRLAEGDLDAALEAADALLAADVAVEEAHRVRMEVFYLRGDRAAAVAAWDDCRHALRSAFGITPSAATRELGELILGSEAQPAAMRGAPAALPAALRRPPQLVGRAPTLAAIARAFALGHGVVVAGVGGIGKTRLMQEAAAAMEPMVFISARPGDHVLPGAVAARLVTAAIERFDPVLDAVTREDIGRLLPSGAPTGEALRSALEHRRVLASVARTMLACHARGMRLVVVDDLQFADDESMAAIQVVVGGWLAHPPESSSLPMFGARPDELRPAAAELVAMMDRSGRSLRIDLAPVGADDVRTLLEELPPLRHGPTDRAALAAALHAQVGGNPAFLLESLRSLWLDGLGDWAPSRPLPMPSTLVASVRQRLQRLPEEALQLAQLAAVARNDFSLALAAGAFGRTTLQLAPLLQALEHAQVFHGSAFSHDLVAEAVQRSVPAALVAALHRIVAGHLIAQQGSPAGIAFHLDAAGAPGEAASWHLKAARLARSRWQMAEAAAGFEAAARALEAGAPVEELSAALAWREAARCRIALSQYAAALRALDHALEIAVTPRERLLVRSSRNPALWNAQRFDEVLANGEALAAELEQHASTLSAAEAAAALFGAVIASPIHPAPERLLRLCERVGPACLGAAEPVRRSYLVSYGICLNWNALPARAAAVLEQAEALARAADDFGTLLNLGAQRMRAELARGDTAAAAAAVDATAQAMRDGRHGGGFGVDITLFRGLLQLARDEPAQALATMREAQQRSLELGRPASSAGGELSAAHALAWLAAGHPDEAAALLEAALAQTDQTPLHRAFFAWARARVAAARGEGPEAVGQALADAARTRPASTALQDLRHRVLSARLLGATLGTLEPLLATLADRGLRALQPSAHLAAAQAAQREGRPDLALLHAGQALDGAGSVDPWVELPAALRREAQALLDAAGWPVTARRPLDVEAASGRPGRTG